MTQFLYSDTQLGGATFEAAHTTPSTYNLTISVVIRLTGSSNAIDQSTKQPCSKPAMQSCIGRGFLKLSRNATRHGFNLKWFQKHTFQPSIVSSKCRPIKTIKSFQLATIKTAEKLGATCTRPSTHVTPDIN